MPRLIKMKGNELVKKLLAREKDLSRIELERGFDLSGHPDFDELLAYLIEQDFYNNPIRIIGSRLIGIRAVGLYLPYVKGQEADLREANFLGANLNRANLYETNLERVNFRGANLREADLEGANFYETNLREADLRGAKNLEKAFNLGRAIYGNTKVTKNEKRIITEELELFDVR